ncbi:Heparin binding hemagglutinin HbhA OS=Streptomyces microflavus OX=1919 GN=HUT09_18990 PE=4 SV=1 [Streptomyces microflavus]
MAITDDLRKTLTDRTPLYFAAGTADLAVQQARKVPALIEQLRAEPPERFEAVRNTDPKVVQEKVTTQAKEAQATVQAKVTEVFGSLDAADLKKLGGSRT